MKRRPDRTDAVDAELIRETLQSHGWQLIKQRIEMEHARKVRDLVRQQSEVETATLRGTITALETVLKIPAILISESKVT